VAIKILAEGLATQSEVARLAGVDRQLVRHWAMRAGIDPAKARAQLLAKLWNKRGPRGYPTTRRDSKRLYGHF
jgi:hypothetical protein